MSVPVKHFSLLISDLFSIIAVLHTTLPPLPSSFFTPPPTHNNYRTDIHTIYDQCPTKTQTGNFFRDKIRLEHLFLLNTVVKYVDVLLGWSLCVEDRRIISLLKTELQNCSCMVEVIWVKYETFVANNGYCGPVGPAGHSTVPAIWIEAW